MFYVTTFEEAIYVLHAFEKRTHKTAQRDIELGQENLAALKLWRKEEGL